MPASPISVRTVTSTVLQSISVRTICKEDILQKTHLSNSSHFPEKKRLIMRGTTPARRKCRNSEDVIIPVGSIKETTERNIIMLTRQIIIYKRTINLFSIIVSLPHGI